MMKVKAFLHYAIAPFCGEPRFKLYPFDMASSDTGQVLIGEVEAEVPDCEPPSKEFCTQRVVAGLEKEKKAILAETHIRVKSIDDRIQNLLCLTNSEQGARE